MSRVAPFSWDMRAARGRDLYAAPSLFLGPLIATCHAEWTIEDGVITASVSLPNTPAFNFGARGPVVRPAVSPARRFWFALLTVLFAADVVAEVLPQPTTTPSKECRP